MKQGKIIKAMKALNILAAQALPIKTACAVHRMRVALRPAWEFQQEEEEKLFSRLHPTFNSDGNLDFKTPKDAQEFREKMKELEEMEAEGIAIQPITVATVEGIRLSAYDIEALDGFVNFTEE